MENQDKVIEVMDKTGCTLEQAGLALSHSDGDIEVAVDFIVSAEKFIFAIKGRFISQKMNVRGMFVILANVKDSRLERIGLLATEENKFYLLDVNSKWNEFEETMYIRKLGDEVNQGMSREMQENIQSMIVNEKDQFFQMLRDMETERVEDILAWEIDQAIKRLGNVEVKINIEQINLNEFKGLEKDEQRKKENENKEEHSPGPSMEVTLQVNMSLDPVEGVQVSSLKVGDVAEAVVVDNREVALHLASAFGGVRFNEFIPVSAVIEDLSPSESGQTRITLRLYKDILGSSALAPDVKIKLISEAQEKEDLQEPDQSEVSSKPGVPIPAFLIAGAALLLILVVFLLLVSR